MRFEAPTTSNPIDQMQVVGRPTDRVDGPRKTSGTAAYANDRHDVAPDIAHGFVVGAGIAKGRIASIDTAAASAAPGVLAVVTAQSAGKLGKGQYNTARLLGGPEIEHYHQAVALVVSETFETARAAAALLRIEYVPASGRYDLDEARHDAKKPDDLHGQPADSSHGDFERDFAAAAVRHDATYTTPDQAHAMMEPHASIAAWQDDRLTLWTSNQMIAWGVADVATTLGIPKEHVHLMSPYIGGGFGGKLFVRADAILAALGAKAAGRPVKVALSRPLMFNNTTHRPATIQRIRIGTDAGGRIQALGHESWSGDLPDGKPETTVLSSRVVYAGASRMTATWLAELDLPESNAMRAPGDAPGQMAMEIAIDEMAERLKMDPIEFRILNDTQVNPSKPEVPFSHRQLTECLRTGANEFGWTKRTAEPGRTWHGRWLVGLGVAAAYRESPAVESGARALIDAAGVVTIETDMTDIGTGSYTIIAQTAAETLGVPLDKVVVRLGDSAFPRSSGSGGQFGANSSTSGVYAACVKLRDAIAQKAGFNRSDIVFANGEMRSGDRSVALGEVAGPHGLSAEDTIEFGDWRKSKVQMSFGAHFVQVRVDSDTGEIRVDRMLAVCSAGRILNPKLARSQVIGAMTMGVGAALMEDLIVDKRRGYFVNHDLASYEVPVHADIPHQQVIFLHDADPNSSPMQAKGVGELGICGVGAAVANALYNATGVRLRDYPMTLDKLLDRLPTKA